MIRGLTSMLPNSQSACGLAYGARVEDCDAGLDYECCSLPRTSDSSHGAVPPKRTFDSGIFEGVDWSVQNFRSANTGFGGGLSNVTNLIAGKAPPRVFAGFGGEPALALMDAVVAMEKFACS